MGRELQKKKRRSGRQPVRPGNKTKKALNPRGNNIVAQNWDKKQTLAQNYRRLGLVSRLKAPTGGTEKKLHERTGKLGRKDPLAIANGEQVIISEAKVERDENGKIIRILGRKNRENPLNDPLNDLESDSNEEDEDEEEEEQDEDQDMDDEWGGIDEGDNGGATDVVKALVEESYHPDEKKPRHLSKRETQWLESLIAKHGHDTKAMARDAKLNPMQQTAADIARRIKKLGA